MNIRRRALFHLLARAGGDGRLDAGLRPFPIMRGKANTMALPRLWIKISPSEPWPVSHPRRELAEPKVHGFQGGNPEEG